MSLSRIKVIAEAGVNHNGSFEAAIDLVKVARQCGADIVKFQTFRAESLATKFAEKANYQNKAIGSSETQFEMLKRLELSFDDFLRIAEYCDKVGIEFLSTAFDEDCLDFLVHKVGIKRIKIPSGELTNGPLLANAATTGLPLIISTGMAVISEIEAALDVIAVSFRNGVDYRSAQGSFRRLNSSVLPVTILHCTTEYPAPFNELNLNAMREIRSTFGLPVGYSDHSEGILAAVMSAGLGATVIEKHFTTSKKLPGPDHKASLDPNELAEMILQIKKIQEMMGTGFKGPSEIELANSKVVRKSLVAKKRIPAGEIFTKDNIGSKRPGTGISPMKFWSLLGQTARRSYEPDDLILEEDLTT